MRVKSETEFFCRVQGMAFKATLNSTNPTIIPKIGDVVLLQKTIACVMYIGPVHWNDNINELYVGLELPEPIPNGHNGTYDNTLYFKCKPKQGIILPISTIIKIITPQELLTKLTSFKTKLNQINDENEKIKEQINKLPQIDHNDDDQKRDISSPAPPSQSSPSQSSPIIIHKDLNFAQENKNGSAELHGLLLEKNDTICKVQLRNIDGKLTDQIIDVDEKYIQIVPDYDIKH